MNSFTRAVNLLEEINGVTNSDFIITVEGLWYGSVSNVAGTEFYWNHIDSLCDQLRQYRDKL